MHSRCCKYKNNCEKLMVCTIIWQLYTRKPLQQFRKMQIRRTIFRPRNYLYECFKGKKIPKSWKSSIMVLIRKKEDNKHAKNCGPISLQRTLLFPRILDENQPIEQADFRSGYSTICNIHIHTMDQ